MRLLAFVVFHVPKFWVNMILKKDVTLWDFSHKRICENTHEKIYIQSDFF